jgi:methanogenic corrinoid protein MtbC1
MRASSPRYAFGTAYIRGGPAAGFDELRYQASVAQRGRLARTIEDQIVPRLLINATLAPPDTDTRVIFGHQDVAGLAAYAMTHDPDATRSRVLAMLPRHPVETLCLELLAPAARHLGALWDDDQCSFADVTIGLLGLQQALYAVTPATGEANPDRADRRRILLAQVPGDQHSFGLSMVQTFFERAAWHVTTAPGASLADLVRQVRRTWFGIIGLSAGGTVQMESLTHGLAQLRQASCNRDVRLMVGGPVFTLQPELVRQVGADATAADGLQATWQAENLLGLQSGAV